jgi:hypothetical protein
MFATPRRDGTWLSLRKAVKVTRLNAASAVNRLIVSPCQLFAVSDEQSRFTLLPCDLANGRMVVRFAAVRVYQGGKVKAC